MNRNNSAWLIQALLLVIPEIALGTSSPRDHDPYQNNPATSSTQRRIDLQSVSRTSTSGISPDSSSGGAFQPPRGGTSYQYVEISNSQGFQSVVNHASPNTKHDVLQQDARLIGTFPSEQQASIGSWPGQQILNANAVTTPGSHETDKLQPVVIQQYSRVKKQQPTFTPGAQTQPPFQHYQPQVQPQHPPYFQSEALHQAQSQHQQHDEPQQLSPFATVTNPTVIQSAKVTQFPSPAPYFSTYLTIGGEDEEALDQPQDPPGGDAAVEDDFFLGYTEPETVPTIEVGRRAVESTIGIPAGNHTGNATGGLDGLMLVNPTLPPVTPFSLTVNQLKTDPSLQIEVGETTPSWAIEDETFPPEVTTLSSKMDFDPEELASDYPADMNTEEASMISERLVPAVNGGVAITAAIGGDESTTSGSVTTLAEDYVTTTSDAMTTLKEETEPEEKSSDLEAELEAEGKKTSVSRDKKTIKGSRNLYSEFDEDVQTEMNELEELMRQRLELDMAIREKTEAVRSMVSNDRKGKLLDEFLDQLEETNAIEELRGVHIMEIPAFQILQSQILNVLQDREQFFRDIVSTVEHNVALMKEWTEIVSNFLVYKENQVIVLFGEFSPVTNILHTGVATALALTEQFFAAVESLTSVQTQLIDSFVTRNGSEEFLKKAQNFTVDELLPAKINFVMNAFKNSEEIAKILGEIIKNANMLLETKYNVVRSVTEYGDMRMNELRTLLGTNLTFVELLETIQRGTFLQHINIGPLEVKGDFFGRPELEKIISHILSMGNPRVPVIGTPFKELMAGTEKIPPHFPRPGERMFWVDRKLTSKLASAAMYSTYRLHVKNGEAVIETKSPPIVLGDKCGIGFKFLNSHGRGSIGRSSQVSLTAGPAFGYGRPPSLDIVISAWLYHNINFSSKVAVSGSNDILGQCVSKLDKMVNFYTAARARSYISLKISVINMRLETRVSSQPESYHHVRVPHIVINFRLHLNGELHSGNLDHLKVSNCDLKIMGVTVFSYCGLLEKILYEEIKDKTSKSLPFKSHRVLHQVEKALIHRLGDEIAIPLFVFGDRPVEKFLHTAQNIIELGQSLVRNVTSFKGQMNGIMDVVHVVEEEKR